MLYAQGSSIDFDVHYTKLGVGVTGLTVTVDVFRGATKIVTGATPTEIEQGLYTYQLAGVNVTTATQYKALFKTDGDVDVKQMAGVGVVGAIEDAWDVDLLDHLGAGSVGEAQQDALKDDDVRLDNLDATISSRSTQVSVDAIPTNPLPADDVRLDNLDATISSRSTQASVDAIPTNPLPTDDARLDNLDVAVSSRATQASVNAIPSNPLLVDDARLNNLDAAISSRSTQASVDAIYAYLQTLTIEIAPEDMQAIAELVLTTGIGTVENQADALSIGALILGTFRASINPVTSKMVIRKANGQDFFAEHPVFADDNASPIIGIGTVS